MSEEREYVKRIEKDGVFVGVYVLQSKKGDFYKVEACRPYIWEGKIRKANDHAEWEFKKFVSACRSAERWMAENPLEEAKAA